MSAENMDKSEASTNSNRTQDENNSPDMATIFQGFQNALTQLVAPSKAQTEAFDSLKGELLGKNDVILDVWPWIHASIFDNFIY